MSLQNKRSDCLKSHRLPWLQYSAKRFVRRSCGNMRHLLVKRWPTKYTGNNLAHLVARLVSWKTVKADLTKKEQPRMRKTTCSLSVITYLSDIWETSFYWRGNAPKGQGFSMKIRCGATRRWSKVFTYRFPGNSVWPSYYQKSALSRRRALSSASDHL